MLEPIGFTGLEPVKTSRSAEWPDGEEHERLWHLDHYKIQTNNELNNICNKAIISPVFSSPEYLNFKLFLYCQRPIEFPTDNHNFNWVRQFKTSFNDMDASFLVMIISFTRVVNGAYIKRCFRLLWWFLNIIIVLILEKIQVSWVWRIFQSWLSEICVFHRLSRDTSVSRTPWTLRRLGKYDH